MRPPVLIIGATSDIARAIARRFAADGHPLQLAARDAARLGAERDDLAVRYPVPVSGHVLDVLDTRGITALFETLRPMPEIVVCAVGLLGNPERAHDDPDAAELILRTNLDGPVLALEAAARLLLRQGTGGVIVGISSVAGERGRASNALYGAAKAGFTAYLSGLRNRLHPAGIHVVTVKPGFVRTRMIAGRHTPGWLTAEPDEIAEAVVRAVRRRQDVVYARPIWRVVMAVVRLLPEALFKRLRL